MQRKGHKLSFVLYKCLRNIYEWYHSVAKESLSATYGRHLVEGVVVSEDGLRSINLTLRDLTKEDGRENGTRSGGKCLSIL